MKTKLFKKPFVYWIFGISFLYLLFTILISKFYVSLWYLPRFAATLNWPRFLISVSFSLVIAFFIGINAVGSYLLYKQRKEQKTCSSGISATKTASITGFGALLGTTTGICTACVGALFPAFFGLFGITLSFGSLPFQGMEIQFGLIIILLTTFYFIQKELTAVREKTW